MFIDPATPIIFIHNPKAAGTSVRMALEQATGIGQATAKIKYDDQFRVSVHSFATAIRAHPRASPVWDDAFKFGIVRNPWDRVASFWFYSQTMLHGMTVLRHGLQRGTRRHQNRAYAGLESRGERAFEFWLTRWADQNRWSPWEYVGGGKGVLAYDQLSWFTDQEGGLIVDRLYRTDELHRLEADLSDRYDRPIKLQVQNQTVRTRLDPLFNDRTRQFVARRFARDIDYFGFEFDNP